MSAEKKVELGAWALFVLSALFYAISNFNGGQYVALAGSIAFLIACGVFIALRLNQSD